MAKVLFIIILLAISAFSVADNLNKNASPLKVDLAAQYSDNFNPTLKNKATAAAFILSVEGELVSVYDALWLQAKYSGEYTKANIDKKSLTNTNSFAQSEFSFLGRLHLLKKIYFDASLEYKQEDELFGRGLSKLRLNIVDADKKKQSNALFGITYGGDADNRSITLNYQQLDTQYSDINIYSQLFSLLQKKLSLNIKFKLSSNTRFIALLEQQNDNYDALLRDDSDKQQIMLGMDWRPSGISTLSFLMGKYQRVPNKADKTTGLIWQLLYKYDPRDDLHFIFSSSQSSIVGESAIASDSVQQQWQLFANYLYSSQWRYYAKLALSNTYFQEVTNSHSLKDNYMDVGVNFNIQNYHHIKLSLNYRNVKDSNGTIAYQQNEASIHWLYDF